MDGSPPGSPVPGILQARTLEWVAISFSNAWKWKVKVKSLSHVWLCATPWTAAHQAPPSTGFSRQEHWTGVPLPQMALILKGLPSPQSCSRRLDLPPGRLSRKEKALTCRSLDSFLGNLHLAQPTQEKHSPKAPPGWLCCVAEHSVSGCLRRNT